MLDAGARDRRIDILMRQETRGAAGDVVVDYVPRCRVWAAITARSGRERMASDQNIRDWDIRVTVLYNASVESTDKLAYRGERYDIQHLGEIGRREGLEILAKRDL